MTSRFEDERGLIEDLLTEPVDAVTRIFTRAGAVRGNHVHDRTVQWAYVVSGSLIVAIRQPGGEQGRGIHGPRSLIREDPGVAHAWKAREDTEVLVFTRGPRSGAGYEDDVRRLPEAERLL